MRRSTSGSGIVCTSTRPGAPRAAAPYEQTARVARAVRRRSKAPTRIYILHVVVTPILALTLLLAAPRAGDAVPLRLVADVPLPGHATRFDYQSVDPVNRRLYIAHLGDSSLLVFDLDGQRVLRELPGLASVHGVVAAPEQHL